MSTRPRRRVCRRAHLLLAVALGAGTAGLSACSAPTPGIQVVGTVEDSITVVAVPTIAMPSVDLNAGFPPAAPTGASTGASTASSASSARSGSPVLGLTGLGGVWRVATTTVREGARVTAGQTIATLDDGILAAQVRAAEAGAATAAAAVPVLADRIAEVDDKHRELTDKRSQLTDALATITSTQSTLTTNRAGLVANRATLQANRAGLVSTRAGLLDTQERLKALLATLPADPSVPLPPGTPTRAEVTAQLAALASGIASADAGLAKIDSGLATLDAGLAKIDAGLAQVKTKATQVRSGLSNIATGRSALADARMLLVDTQTIARIAVDTAAIGVTLARQQQALATVTTPVSGVVVAIADAGDLLAPGAVLATIRADGPASVRVWLAPDQVSRVCLADPAMIRGDWMTADAAALPGALPASVSASVSAIGDRADYPPSFTVTDEVHLTRAVPVDVTTAHDPLPAGVPVQVTLLGCR